MWDIWLSGFRLPALTVADELGLFAYLDASPATATDIAEHFKLSLRASEALINLLCSLGFLVKQNGVYNLSELARNYLLPESPYYWGGVLHTVKDMPVSHAMLREAMHRDTVHAGGPTKTFTESWENNTLTHEQARKFTAKMHSHGFSSAVALARSDAFHGVRSLLDVGGGSGAYAIALAAAHPDLRCTVADLPQVCPITQQYIESYGMTDRIRTLALDMFKDRWPRGHDAIFFSDILHDWERSRCLWLLKNSLENLPPGGWLFVHEVLLADGKVGPTTANAYSLAMLMVTKGQQFTAGELESMFAEAGFIDISTSPAHSYYSLISGRRP